MARPGVTYLEVVDAANQLLGQGKKPTIEQVRRLLGTGSSTTLSNHLRHWKKSHDQNQISKAHLPSELLSLVKGLWEQLLNETEKKQANLESAHQTQVEKLLAELQKYKKNNQRWQQLYHQWQDEKKQLNRTKLTAEQLIQHVQRENVILSEKKAVLAQQLQDKQERIQELLRLHQQVQTNMEHFRESTRTQRLREQQRFEKEIQELQMQLKELKSQKAREKNESLKLQKQNQAYLQKTQHLKILCQELKQKNEIESQKGFELQMETRVLATHLSQVKEQLNEALEQNKYLSQEKWAVAQEKSQLEGQLKQLQNMLKKQEA